VNTGFYSAFAGFAARMDELEVVANNLANVNTAGFKAHRDFYRSLEASLAGEEPTSAMMTVSQAVERASNQFGVLAGTRLDLSQASVTLTGNETDVALEGSGFFTVMTKNGLRYTRNGTFRLDKDRNLVTEKGDKVLGLGGPLQIPTGKLAISGDGTLSVDGAVVGQLQVEEFTAGTPLVPEGDTYLSAPAKSGKPATDTTVRQGSLESSNADAIRSTVQLIDLERSSQIMEKALGIFHNEFNKTAAQDLPRV
jgi:flagellar basal-body rod protein FlgF